jgi:hypothetical protein
MLIPIGDCRMPRPSSQQIKGMRQQRQNRRQRTLCPRRAARQVHNQRPSQRPAHRTAQSGKRRMQQPIGAHAFRQSINQPFTDQPRCLRRHIPRSQPCSPCCHNEICAPGMKPQRRRNQVHLIRQRLGRHRANSGTLQQLANRRSREVNLLSSPAAVADRQHYRANIGRKTRSHPPSLRVSSIVSETSSLSPLRCNRHQK